MNDYNTSTAVENTNSSWFGFHEGIIHLQNWFITYITLSGPVKYYLSLSNGRIIEHNSINLLTNSAKNRNVFQFNWVQKECAEPFFLCLLYVCSWKRTIEERKCWQMIWNEIVDNINHFHQQSTFPLALFLPYLWFSVTCELTIAVTQSIHKIYWILLQL